MKGYLVLFFIGAIYAESFNHTLDPQVVHCVERENNNVGYLNTYLTFHEEDGHAMQFEISDAVTDVVLWFGEFNGNFKMSYFLEKPGSLAFCFKNTGETSCTFTFNSLLEQTLIYKDEL